MIRFSSVQRSARLDNKWKSGTGVTVRSIIWTQATSDAKKIDVISQLLVSCYWHDFLIGLCASHRVVSSKFGTGLCALEILFAYVLHQPFI